MPFAIQNDQDRAMSDAHTVWAKARANELGRPDDPNRLLLGVAVWPAAFRAGVEYQKSLAEEDE